MKNEQQNDNAKNLFQDDEFWALCAEFGELLEAGLFKEERQDDV